MCDVAPELCEEYGEGKLARSIGFGGTNVRLKRFFDKAARGEGFTVGLIGGSVSKGFGLNEHGILNEYNPRNLGRVIFDNLNELYPAPNGTAIGKSGSEDGGGKNGFVNGAQGGTGKLWLFIAVIRIAHPALGSDYFSLCFKEHIPEDVDLIIVELAVNDQLILKSIDQYELMVRGLLDLPNQPAIISLEVPALVFHQIGLGGDMHESVSQYYDIPIISLRNAILPDILADNELVKTWFAYYGGFEPADNMKNFDKRHGHRLIGNLTSAYFDTVRCEMERDRPAKIDTTIPPLPRLRLTQSFDYDAVTLKIEPSCFSMNSEKHKLVPVENDGWREWNWEKKNYLIADKPGSTISFAFSVAMGKVTLSYQRSAAFGLGSINCWVDDDRASSRRVDGYWENNINVGQSLTLDGITPGSHTLHCELLEDTKDPGGGKEFRIISVMR
ncbi:hypothetical protein BCR39DRAFT_568808 [Naematelia encephala]|uniref:SGNH hydrolase-type esterase domain-containing protein n=1 Tax=Naematelia encephala TaxID=71784 RepID=A0A1Y2BMC8_9TREE|nr:hypothetical protein BCR39DRAFT_568808 [Naematelia encephala]